MSCCVDLHYLLDYRCDLHCGMSGDWSGEFSWFVPPLALSQLCQRDHKKQFIKKSLSNSEYRISKTKDTFLTTTVILFLTKCVVLTLTLWCQMAVKGQTYLNKLTGKNCCLLRYAWPFIITRHEELSGKKFQIMTLFKTLIRNSFKQI